MRLCVEETCLFVFLVYVTWCCLCCLISFRNAVSGESIVLVVSPLKALMADQVDICCVKGLKSVCVCGDEESKRVYNSVVIIEWFLSVQRY